MNTAVIVAAGRSSRLYPLTKETPKCLLRVGGQSMISRSVDSLRAHGVGEILVVVGYYREKVMEHLGSSVRYVHNPFYAYCNNMGSLWFAAPYLLGRPFLYLHGDIVYHPRLLKNMLEAPEAPIRLLVDFGPMDTEAMKVRLLGGKFVSSSKDIPIEEAAGEWTGIASFSASGSAMLFSMVDQLLGAGELNAYDTLAFSRLANGAVRISITGTSGLSWIEVDDQEDLEIARTMFGGVT